MNEQNTKTVQDNLANKLSIQSQLTLFFIIGVLTFVLLGSFVNGTLTGMRYEMDLTKQGESLIRFLNHEAIEHIAEGDIEKLKRVADGVLLDTKVKHIGVYDGHGKTLFSSKPKMAVKHQKRLSTEGLANKRYKTVTLDNIRYFIYPIALTGKYGDVAIGDEIGFVVVGLDNSLIFNARIDSFIWTFIITLIIAILMMGVVYLYMGHVSKPIKELAQAMSRAQSGVSGVRVSPSGPLEIYAMGQGFNEMINQLEQRTTYLARQKNELESVARVREITEHALKESTEKLTAVVNGAADGIVIVDEQLNIEIMNPAAERLFKYEQVIHQGLHISNLVPSLGEQINSTGPDSLLREFNNTDPFETVGHSADKQTFPVELTVSKMSVDGRVGFVVILRDIKERILAQKALMRFKLSLDSSEDGIYIIDYKSMRFIDFNKSAWVHLGYSESELIKLGPHDIQPYSTRSNIEVTFNNIVNGNTGAGRIETVFRRKDGSEFPVEIFMRSIVDEGEQLIIAVARDITERKRFEYELISYRDHLEEMVEMQTQNLVDARDSALAGEKAMSTFLANMSHELRTPLHGILSFSSIGIKKVDTAEPDKIKGFLIEIQESGQNLLRLLNDLLDLSKLKSGKMVYEYHMNSMVNLVERVVRELDMLATSKSLSIKMEVFGDEVDVSMDCDRIMQVLRNLYSNAIKFSNDKSEIMIGVDFTSVGYVTVNIKDSGLGIPDNELDWIFDSFVQSSITANNAGGTGLGLSISKEIISKGHSGRLVAENRQEGGAVFSFTIPAGVDMDKSQIVNSALHISLS